MEKGHGSSGSVAFEPLLCAVTLPARPHADLPSHYCSVPGRRFSFVPMKHRAELTLPPVAMRHFPRTRSEGALRRRRGACYNDGAFHHLKGGETATCGQRKARSRIRVNPGCTPEVPVACCGQFCDECIRWPASMENIESSDDPWAIQARELCKKKVRCQNGEELPIFAAGEVAAYQDACGKPPSGAEPCEGGKKIGSAAPSRPCCGTGPGQICLSWILEAQCHPSLCRWLQTKAGWKFNARDPDQLLEAARRIEEDGEALVGSISSLIDTGRARSGTCGPGLKYRLREVPVCGTCFCIYSIVHSVVNAILVRNKGQWASWEQERRSRHEEHEEAQKMQAMIEKCKARRCSSDSSSIHSAGTKFRCSGSAVQYRSVLMDPETQAWLYGLDLDGGSADQGTTTRGTKHAARLVESSGSSLSTNSGRTSSRTSSITLAAPED